MAPFLASWMERAAWVGSFGVTPLRRRAAGEDGVRPGGRSSEPVAERSSASNVRLFGHTMRDD